MFREGVPNSIQHKKSDGRLFEPSENFNLFLINSGTAVLELNGKECFLGGRIVICTNKFDEIKLIHQSKVIADVLNFAPEFINVNLNWNIIRGYNYGELRKRHGYPDFKLFLKRFPIYNGILLLDENGYDTISKQISQIEYQLSEKPDGKWSCRSRGLLFQIMDILELYYEKYAGNYSQDSFVWDICQYINLNLASSLSLEHMSRYFLLNRTTLSKRFKAVKDSTISEYIKTKRMDRIKHLLAFTELHLSEIGEQVGYYDPTYLSKVFLKNEGITPLKYRNKMKNDRFPNPEAYNA